MTNIILKTVKELNEWRITNQKNISFIPTMGNLHLGHKELICKAKKSKQNLLLLSIFINPLQFNDKDDLRNYPRTINKDIDLAFNSGVDAIFIPFDNEIFPKNEETIKYQKASEDLSQTLCGLFREGHFDGVCTVIYRLLDIVKPETIFLGEKDWQQLIIIKEMIAKQKISVSIKTINTQRDKDGVPFSSRNNLLIKSDREKLKLFSTELIKSKKIFNQTKKIDLNKLIKRLIDKDIQIEYLEHVNAFDLKRATSEINITMLAGAIICGSTRLIDHVFLMKRNPIIAIDGPAGSGKSTVTKLIAKKLNFIFLDTGAMYRALSWYLLQEKINYDNGKELNSFLNNISITFQSGGGSKQHVIINNYDVTEKIRSQEISSIVSSIASIKEVREFLVKEQRKIGETGGIVAEGRDIGTKVFPNAELKIFLTATINERAKRRKIELEEMGEGIIDFEKLKNEIEKRDFDDSNRKLSPLIKAEDAIEIITDGNTVSQVVEKILEIYLETIPKELQHKIK